jgi:hypothetical protein
LPSIIKRSSVTVTAALAASGCAVPDVVMTMEVAPKVRMGVNVVSPEENVPAGVDCFVF